MTRRLLLIGTLALALGAASAGIALAAGSGDGNAPVSALDRAAASALEHLGGGTVVETEAGDDGAAYGVEVRLDDGRVVEVELDAGFQVIGQAADDEGSDAGDGRDAD